MNAPTRDEKAIFLSALEKESVSQREFYLQEVCGDDAAMLARIRELLASHEGSLGPLDAPPSGLCATADLPAIDEKPGTQIGPYKLLQRIGEGGFGVVYMAEQQNPVRRKVALKIIKPGMDTKEVIARFEAERQALALMDHPNIAKVFDAGATDQGRPYFVMELVKGVPLIDFCDENQLTTKQRLELFVKVCRAIQHAHQKGIIHRDLKPSNVMVTIHDNLPVPKVIDFGVSKAISQQLTEKTLFTAYGQMVGTPTYMSPEQAQMSGLDVDTRSDIYSLGVMLFELLTGSTPLDARRLRKSGYEEMQRLIREEEAPRPSQRLSTQSGDAIARIAKCRGADAEQLEKQLRGELDWIVIKALEKDRNRRYETGNGFANDIERFLNDEAVEACPPSLAYQMRKFMRRHRGLVGASAAVLGILLLGVVGTTVGMVRANRASILAQLALEDADQERTRATNLAREREAEAQRALDAKQEAERQREEARAVVELLGEMIGSTNPEELKGPQYTVLELLEDFSGKLDDRLIDQPAVEATVRLMISAVYHQFRTNSSEGRANAQRALELRRQLYGANHELTVRAEQAKALHDLFGTGRNAVGGAVALQKIVDQNPPLMKQDPEFAIRTKNGAIVLLKGEESTVAYRELLAEAEAKLGDGHALTCGIRSNYAGSLRDSGDLDQAEQQLRKAVADCEQSLGKNSPLTIVLRGVLAGVFIERGDDQRAGEILLANLDPARQRLGAAHKDTIHIVRRLVEVYERQGKPDLANDLFADFSEELRDLADRQSLTAAYWLAYVWLSRASESEKFVELAAEIYLNWLGEGNRKPVPLGVATANRIANAARRSYRSDLAAQVASAAWEAYGRENATTELAGNFVMALRSRGDYEAIGEFLLEHIAAKSDLFQDLDRNADRRLDSVELSALLGPRFVLQTDNDGDQRISAADTGELLWRVVSILDENGDGFIDSAEYMPAHMRSQFAKRDLNNDGYLVFPEAPAGLLANRDQDADGRLSEEEFIDGVLSRQRRFPENLTPAQRFAEQDLDGDDRVSKEEADGAFWERIAEFDTNGDDAVDREEFESGRRERSLAVRRRLFRGADTNEDGQLSAKEVGKAWENYKRLDRNGDNLLNEDEWLER